jgi:dTDP-4-amino-4,6-dideoxygalactose transaminase
MLMVAEPVMGTEEKIALAAVVDSGWITMGDRVREFELEFGQAHGIDDAVAVSSCTAALHLILHALGVGPGDEVLVPSMTFVATVNSVLYVGATPVFVDIESLDLPLISTTDAASKCNTRTKAIIIMHYAGYLVDCDAWRKFADSRGIFLIEDAAHAAGADEAGTFGHAAAFSLYGNKNMTTAEGGVVTSASEELLEKIRCMRGHGMTSSTFQRLSSGSVTYDVTMLGFNYRMDELRASVGLVQLKNLMSWNKTRMNLTNLYMRLLQQHCQVVAVPFAQLRAPSHVTSSYHILPIVLPAKSDRASVVSKLRDVGIQTTSHYPPAHLFSFYIARFPSVSLPVTEEFGRRQVTLPLHPRIEDWQVEMVVTELAHILAR